MDDIALNFVPLKEQSRSRVLYRRRVEDGSKPKAEDDFRASLPETHGYEEWITFDICSFEKDGYERYEYDFSLNQNLSVHLIYVDICNHLKSANAKNYYLSSKAISLKEICFIVKGFVEGNSEISVRPYFLREKSLYGFLLEHRFSLAKDQQFNRQTQILSLSLDKSGKPNIYFYRDKKHILDNFSSQSLASILEPVGFGIESSFSALTAKSLDYKTYLVGAEHTSRSQFVGIKNYGPYRSVSEKVRYLFVFSERTRSLARDIYLGLSGKLFPGQFSGLADMFALPIPKDSVEHKLVPDFDSDSIREIEQEVLKLQAQFREEKIMVIAVLPRGYKGVDAAFDAYGHIKLIALKTNIYCQVVTEDTFFKRDQLKWSISNIGLQVFSKLGGAPWLVKPAKNNCLIFGLGSVQERQSGSTVKYSAYTVCLDSSGDFKYIKPLSSSSDEQNYLINFRKGLNQVLSSEIGEKYRTFVLHIPYKISKSEIDAIKDVVRSIRKEKDFEIVVIRINTKHKFLGFSSHNTCVPYESTFVQISKNEFLLWAEGLQHGKEVLHRRVSEPLYINFIESQENWESKRECLQDILNLTGANWRGFNSKAQPISILYSRLIAKFMKEFSHLENVSDLSIVSAESTAPWFL